MASTEVPWVTQEFGLAPFPKTAPYMASAICSVYYVIPVCWASFKMWPEGDILRSKCWEIVFPQFSVSPVSSHMSPTPTHNSPYTPAHNSHHIPAHNSHHTPAHNSHPISSCQYPFPQSCMFSLSHNSQGAPLGGMFENSPCSSFLWASRFSSSRFCLWLSLGEFLQYSLGQLSFIYLCQRIVRIH